jgi:tartrate dehydrogenase/decarboxylase / D-malate dehydrogenase
MKTRDRWRVAILPGDGIGPEVMGATLPVLRELAARGPRLELVEFPWPSSDWHRQHGVMMPPDWRTTLGSCDAILLGALGDPGPVEDPDRYRLPDGIALAPLLELRRGFDQWACERPAILLPGAPRYLADPRSRDVDMLVIRENSEGEYVGHGGRSHIGTEHETATQIELFTRFGAERIFRHAFERARRRAGERREGRRSPRQFRGAGAQALDAQVCLITKRNALTHWGELYGDVFAAVAESYPDVAVHHELVDAACMKFVTTPWQFDVVVASNLQGDILTDLAAVLCGGMGLAPSCNLNPGDRSKPSMFEPTHGTAPDIAGRGLAHPGAMLLTAAMMLDWMGEEDAAAAIAAKRLHEAVAADLSASGARPRATADVGSAVLERLRGEGGSRD